MVSNVLHPLTAIWLSNTQRSSQIIHCYRNFSHRSPEKQIILFSSKLRCVLYLLVFLYHVWIIHPITVYFLHHIPNIPQSCNLIKTEIPSFVRASWYEEITNYILLNNNFKVRKTLNLATGNLCCYAKKIILHSFSLDFDISGVTFCCTFYHRLLRVPTAVTIFCEKFLFVSTIYHTRCPDIFRRKVRNMQNPYQKQ